MIDTIIHNFQIFIILFVRIVTVSAAVLLIARSIAGRFLPKKFQVFFSTLFCCADVLVEPVRHFLPERLCFPKTDFSPLVTAIIILLIGLGFERLVESFVYYSTF